MTVDELILDLDEKGIRLSVDHDLLKVAGPKGVLAPDLVGELKRLKPEIITRLQAPGGSLQDHLTDVEKQIWSDHVRWSVGNGVVKDKAESDATEYVRKTRNVLQARQATEDYERRGFVKIYSTVLDREIYLVKSERVAGIVPDKSIPGFTEEEVMACKGLSREEAKILLEARLTLGGQLKS